MKNRHVIRSIAFLLAMIMVVSLCPSAYAGTETSHTLSIGLNAFFEVGDDIKLTERTETSHMSYVDDMRNSVEGSLAMEILGLLYGTGAEPDEAKYMEVLINIMKTYEMENAAAISEQHQMDNLKAIEDYGMDALDIGVGLIPSVKGVDKSTEQLGEWIKIAISGLETMAGNTTSCIEGISNLETIVQNYAKHDAFLALIEAEADGTLKSAASVLRTSMTEAMKIKLDMYSDISEENFQSYTEFFFEDLFFEALKLTDLYETDSGFRGFVDIGTSVFKLWTTLKVGVEIGKFVGNLAVGAEDVINRVLEMKAVYDISEVLEGELTGIKKQFTNSYSDETDAMVQEYIAYGNYLISSRIRGEYCMYSMLAKDSGLYSHFGDETARKAERVYNHLTAKLEEVYKSLEMIPNVLVVSVGSEMPYEAVNAISEWNVYGADGQLYDNYTLRVYDKQSLLNFVRTGSVDGSDPTVTEYVVDSAEPLQITLEKGYAYTFEFVDGNDPEKIELMTVGVTDSDSELTTIIDVETNFGEIARVVYEMRETTIEFKISDGTLYYSNTIQYPYFLGNSVAELGINNRYASMIEGYKNNTTDFDTLYQEMLKFYPEGINGLPYSDDVTVEVTYNEKGYISLYEVYTIWSGGMHPYSSENAITLRLEDGKECTYEDILVGPDSQRIKLARYYIEEVYGGESGYLLEQFYDNTYTLTEKGVCFYVRMGDAVAPLEVIIPYTSDETCVVSVEDALKQIGYTEQNIDIGEYLNSSGFTIGGQEFADKFEDMSHTKDIWNIYNDSSGTFVEANDKDEIFRIEWSTENINLYDLTVGSTYKEIKDTLFEKGYQLDEGSSRVTAKKFVYGNISIWIFFNHAIESVTDSTTVVWFEIDLSE